ncbi:MAG: TonB-dependent receptor [Sphingomonas sp. 28-62-20]|uniref:TonB-dependent receptor n=1 Tax=Sphingomonas sp. 28-62-20 TaxID=1970433 RepID=UPI000BC67A91|nr:MAG: TonB-dependent receptor [Sphingomonas sp. 28-62-20]
MKKFELLAASAIAMLAVTPAYAKNAPTPANAPVQAEAPAQEADDTEDSDIVVTASKREATLLDTPIAVSVVSGSTIQEAQIRDLIDLQSVVPSLRVSQLQSSANTNFIIRGFGNGANNAGIEPSVGVFIDGVYRSRSAAQIADLPNLKRVEVLRGPQSTLFGKNASAGIISIVTSEPSFTTRGSAEVTYGNYNAFIAKGDISGPITDTLAYSVAGNYNRRDGYVFDAGLQTDSSTRNRYGFRAQLLFQPSADLKFRLIADYDRISENCCAIANIVAGPTTPIINSLAAGGRAIDAARPFSYVTFSNFPSSNDITNYGFSLQGDYSLGNLDLTSISAYRKVRSFTNQDSDFTSADLIGNNSQALLIDTFTQELRLTSNFDGPLNFILGGFYFNEKINQNNAITYGQSFRPYGDALIRAGTGGALNAALLEGTFGALEGAPTRYLNTFFRRGDGLNERYRLTDESFSVFATVDYKITDRVTLTGGINYTDDRKRFATNVASNDVFSNINFNDPRYAPFRNQLILGGLLAQGVPLAQAQAGALANQNNPAANPLNGLRGLQFLPPGQNVPNAVEPGRTGDTNLSYTGRLSWKATDNLSLYVTYASGFKASSINLSRDSRPTVADLARLQTAGLAVVNLTSGSRFAGPEQSEVYEGGIKGKFGKAAFNIAVFKQNIKGFQGNIFTGTGFILNNAGQQSTFGIEFDGSITPVKNLSFNADVTYLDPIFDSFVNGSAFNATFGVVPANLTGRRPAGIPEFAFSVGSSYTHEVNDNFKLTLRGDYQYNTPVLISEGSTLTREVQSLNMSLTGQFSNGIEISAWGRNMTNAQYLTTIFPSVAQAGSLSGYPSQPVTYGGTVRIKF